MMMIMESRATTRLGQVMNKHKRKPTTTNERKHIEAHQEHIVFKIPKTDINNPSERTHEQTNHIFSNGK
eukprot:9975844-Heterocapsa_arctica.AAC.1